MAGRGWPGSLASLLWLATCLQPAAAEGVTGWARMEEGAGLEDVAGRVILHQATNSSPVKVSGEVAGLPEGAFVLRLVEAGCGAGCQGGNCGPQLWVWDQAENETVRMGLSSFEPEAALLEAGTGVGLNIEQCLVGPNGQNCDQGERLVCTDLQWTASTDDLPWAMLAIIAAAAAIFLIIVLLAICCCVRRLRSGPVPPSEEGGEGSLEDSMDRGKSPMFDELSLPFIDQSLPPTPKVGRIVNGLDLLLGNAGSCNSLVGEVEG